jgi:hypothetical protein
MTTTLNLEPSAAAAASRAAAGVRGLVARMWRASPSLTATGVVMAAAAAGSLIGLAVDPRIITGAPAWLKPFKFAMSSAIYAVTLAWIFTHLMDRARLRRVVGWTTAIVFVLEVGIIDVQAARGTISHFNAAAPVDQVLYAVMGAAIMVQTLISIAVAVVLWRRRFTDRPLGWALRLGMTITIAGALTGPLMTRPTPAQVEALRAGEQVTAIGAHTVGGPDGGAGLPVTQWSRDHGDVRVPHFIGLHAMQALALIAIGLGRWRRSDAARLRMTLVAGASYAALFGVTLWQALSGYSVVGLGAGAVPLALWAAATAVAGLMVIGGDEATQGRALEVAS